MVHLLVSLTPPLNKDTHRSIRGKAEEQKMLFGIQNRSHPDTTVLQLLVGAVVSCEVDGVLTVDELLRSNKRTGSKKNKNNTNNYYAAYNNDTDEFSSALQKPSK